MVKQLEVFLIMECEIQRHNIQIPDRPPTHSLSDLAALREAYAGDDIEAYETDTVLKMREATKGRNPKLVDFKNYILDRRGPHDWREFKNPARDYPRVALISFVEPLLVKKYRKELLNKSLAAQYLRLGSQQILTRFSKPRQIIKAKKLAVIRRYDLPDELPLISVDLPEYDVDDLLWELSDARNIAEHLDVLKSTIKKLESLPFAVARPDVSLLNPTIKQKIDNIREVRRIPHITLHYNFDMLGLRGQHLQTVLHAKEGNRVLPRRPSRSQVEHEV